MNLSPTFVRVEHLVYDHPGHRALDDVSFTLPAGSITALVGPNGAGKTTLMRCMAALSTPLQGRVWLGDLDVQAHPREAHRLLGYLSDQFGLYNDLGVVQCLTHAARSRGLSATETPRAVTHTAHRMGLSDKLGQTAASLSRGQRQRLAIGQAIIHAPQLLLLDEPANGLDPEARSALALVFKELQSQGMTLLVSSHILAELDEYSTHLLALHQGRILDHRALSSPQAHHPHAGTEIVARALRMELAAPQAEWGPWLQSQAGVEQVQVEGCTAHLHFNGTLTQQAQLLRGCVQANFEVVALHTETENLQQSYLKSLQAERRRLNAQQPLTPSPQPTGANA